MSSPPGLEEALAKKNFPEPALLQARTRLDVNGCPSRSRLRDGPLLTLDTVVKTLLLRKLLLLLVRRLRSSS